MNKYQEVKQELKSLVKKIKAIKIKYKEAQRQNKHDSVWRIGCDVNGLRYEFRHRHIVMSIIRGRKREEIERPADDNQPSEKYIQELVEHYEQTLRSDS